MKNMRLKNTSPLRERKNHVMDAPTFADVRRGLVDTESLRIESMEKAGIELSMPSFNSPAEELERCVKQFGFKGVMVNGYSNTGLHRQ